MILCETAIDFPKSKATYIILLHDKIISSVSVELSSMPKFDWESELFRETILAASMGIEKSKS